MNNETIAQCNVIIPEDINNGLAMGIYTLCGSVVRWAKGPQKGKIVKHLDTIESKDLKEVETGVFKKMFSIMKKHKKITLIAGGVLIIGGVAYHIYKKVNNEAEPKEIIEFNTCLQNYINAINKRTMSSEIIDQLINAINKIKRNKEYKNIRLMLNDDFLENMVCYAAIYTDEFAKVNKVKVKEKTTDESADDKIVDLQWYLSRQKDVFTQKAM
ncbi:MAG: hypothetical protein MJ131_10345 [Lachnospiraceae bacterium]|nr:hypothetical protein [Lachnospiraceae bacterium]